MKKILAVLTAITVFGAAGVVVFYTFAPTLSQSMQGSSSANLVVVPQNATSSVNIASATLPVDGYVVVRGIIGTRLSQIIEISPFLSKGRYKNITVNYGDENPDNVDLIVMLYADNGDQSFSGNTRPYKDETGKMIAAYVKTGQPVPDSITEPTVMMDKTMGMNMATVHYTNKGFDPKALTVSAGTMVEFINETDGEMWVASNPHPQHSILPTFDEFESVPKGGTYTYTFDKKGTWPYHDHMHASVEGVINVQ